MVMPIVQAGEPVLRVVARDLSRDEIRSREIKSLIDEMRETMRAAPGVGLAAPQIGQSIRLVVIEDPASKTGMTDEQLRERGRVPVPFHVLINPQLGFDSDQTVDFYEGCLSVDGFAALTPRHLSVTVHALDHKGKEFSRRATGWYARILQHEIDHLNGMLYIDRMYTRTFSTVQNRAKFWDLPIAEVRERLGIE